MRFVSTVAHRFNQARYLPPSLVVMRVIAIAGIALGAATLVVALSIVNGFQREYSRAILDFNAHVVVLKAGEMQDLSSTLSYLSTLEPSAEERAFVEKRKWLMPAVETLSAFYTAAKKLHDDISFRFEDHPEFVDVWKRYSPERFARFAPDTVRRLHEIEGKGIHGITPFLYREGLAISKGIIKGMVVKGIDPETIRDVNRMRIDLTSGGDLSDALAPSAEEPAIVLGKALAEQLGSPGKVKLMVPEMIKGQQFITARVAGTFESGLHDYDAQFALMGIPDTRRIFETGPVIASGIEIKLDDPAKAETLAYRLNNDLPASYQAVTWGELNRDLFEALSLEKFVFSIIMGILVIVAAFNIIGVLVLLIVYRAHEVAILKALGVRDSILQRIFTRGGLSTGIIGTTAGIALGTAVSLAVKRLHLIRLEPEVYFLSALPIDISWTICGMIGFFSILMCWGTSGIAARRLSRLPIGGNL